MFSFDTHSRGMQPFLVEISTPLHLSAAARRQIRIRTRGGVKGGGITMRRIRHAASPPCQVVGSSPLHSSPSEK